MRGLKKQIFVARRWCTAIVNPRYPCYCLNMKRLFLLMAFFSLLSAAAFAAQAKKVDIFITSWCPYCRKLEGFLKKNNIDYTRHDVEADSASEEEFARLGGEGVPLARVGDKVIHGYDPEEILEALRA